LAQRSAPVIFGRAAAAKSSAALGGYARWVLRRKTGSDRIAGAPH